MAAVWIVNFLTHWRQFHTPTLAAQHSPDTLHFLNDSHKHSPHTPTLANTHQCSIMSSRSYSSRLSYVWILFHKIEVHSDKTFIQTRYCHNWSWFSQCQDSWAVKAAECTAGIMFLYRTWFGRGWAMRNVARRGLLVSKCHKRAGRSAWECQARCILAECWDRRCLKITVWTLLKSARICLF